MTTTRPLDDRVNSNEPRVGQVWKFQNSHWYQFMLLLDVRLDDRFFDDRYVIVHISEKYSTGVSRSMRSLHEIIETMPNVVEECHLTLRFDSPRGDYSWTLVT